MKRKLTFNKMHGLGNDFILIDSQKNPEYFTNNTFNLSAENLSLIANRNLGIGCDQILIIGHSTNNLAQYDYLIYNQDGSIAEYCGNGARCVIRYLIDTYNLTIPITLNTNGKLTTGYAIADGKICISCGKPEFNPKLSGYTKEVNKYNNYSFLLGHNLIPFGIASMGNPHVVIHLDNTQQLFDTTNLETIGKALQTSGLFKNSVNVNFFVVSAPNQIHLRTYERGVGFTLACGSGACATASLAILNSLCNKNVSILMPGGSLEISWDQINEIEMTGDAVNVFEGTISL